MMNQREKEGILEKSYDQAFQLKQDGKSTTEIEETLMSDGLNEESAKMVADKMETTFTDDDDSGCGGWIIWIVILLVINLLSYIFDWPFWIY